MSGLGAVWRKEMRELYLRGGASRTSIGFALVLNSLVAAALPWAVGGFVAATGVPGGVWLAAWVAAGFALGAAAFFGLLQVMATSVDALAGERERHTLETLLATPVSDGALLMGKAFAQVALPVALGAWTGAVFLVSAAVAFGSVGAVAGMAVLLLGPAVAGTAALLMCGLAMACGARAATVKQGQQWMATAMMPLILGPFLLSSLPLLGSPALVMAVSLGLPLVLLLVLGVAWALAVRWTRRSRLLRR